MGRRRAAAPLPERANLYLFSTLGNVQQAELHTAGRTWIVLWASGAALVAGLLLIYVPASRHPATLLVVGIVLLAAGLIAPEPTLLLAQAASLGLALTLLAGLLERGVEPATPSNGRPQGTVHAAGRSGFHPLALPLAAGQRSGLHRDHAGDPAAIPRECRPMSVQSRRAASVVGREMLLAWLLSAAAASVRPGRAKTGPAAGVIRFRRVLAPEDRIKDWPLGDGKYLPVDAAEFERLVAAVQSRGAGAPVAPAAAIISARYEAKLVGDHLVGQASAEVILAGPAPAMLPFEPCNLALGKIAWDTAACTRRWCGSCTAAPGKGPAVQLPPQRRRPRISAPL